MLREFLKNSFIYNIGNILTRGISIILLPLYTKYLSPSEYGIIDLFFLIASVVNIVITLEISQGIARYYQDTDNEKDKRDYCSTAFWFTVIVYSFFLIFSHIFSDFFTQILLEDPNKKHIFLFAVFSVASNGIFYFTQNQLKWQIQPKENVIINLLNFLVVSSLSIYLLIIKKFGLEGIFISQICANFIATFFAIFFARKSYGFYFSKLKFKKMMSYSLPLVFSGIGVFVALHVDRLAIKDLMGLDKLGIYGVAYRFAAIASLVTLGFQQSLSPLIFKYHRQKKTRFNIANIFNIFVIFASLVISVTILFSRELVILFTEQAYYSSANLISILIIAVFISKIYIFAPGIAIAKKTKLIFVITTISATLNTLLNYTLIPMFGLFGAAYATLTSTIVASSFYLILSNRYYPVPYKIKSLLIIFGLIILSSFVILKFFNEINLISIIFKVFSFVLMSLISIFFLRKKFTLQNFIKK